MPDIAFEIRMHLMRVNPALSVSETESLIGGIPETYAEISSDDQAHNSERQDYYNFSLLSGVALATVFRESEIEVFAFPADESLIFATRHLAMVDVAEFLQIARDRFNLPEVPLHFLLADALPWLGAFIPPR
jgi:hypothetical protein